MGGHGGLNILPQKRWNVYNFENREKVRKDEEAAAKEEQLKREQARKRDAEFRLEQLRAARGLAPLIKAGGAEPASEPVEVVESESKSGHINLFEGIKIFDPIKGLEKEGAAEKDGFKRKKLKKEEVAPKPVAPEDEKYRLGYGVAGKGVKLPWYLERRNVDVEEESENDRSERAQKDEGRKTGKKTIEELREERLKRERREKERERALFIEKSKTDRSRTLKDRRFSRR
ncbi:PREDICTED: leukocyte receptor cluster member 1 [Theobroma cacao]|uniref:Leukocyte receptor cluster member 1 n=1 Tax=Theobroma cacao TaxID=3641 RepID=A0AB32VBS1_THECC|nr:PREDICTED: leukocyte receptor cluster member 1 [Theobroma cacao]XP_017973769.1 PREDICTED: leukocyte receptor cluster member 1 [Theobroma cacao]XP_017973770.1 PREDICTED: leukocyte receptor cluster member 1 [Theobroma cacao]